MRLHNALFICIAAALLCACDADNAMPLVDETGFIRGPLVRYSAISPLAASEISVVIIGLPGAVTPAGGELTVATTTDLTPLPATVADDGSFVALVMASLDETVTLTYLVDTRLDTLDITLTDPLSGVAAPTVAPSSSGPGVLRVDASSDGTVSIDLSQLVDRTTDVIVFNEANGSTRELAPQDTAARLPGATGDRICIFAVDAASADASATLCTNVP
ncbi:MAG: hypothetical protein ACI9MR_003672 [Myxococcota bacterium]|jgi:hypothetical protein